MAYHETATGTLLGTNRTDRVGNTSTSIVELTFKGTHADGDRFALDLEIPAGTHLRKVSVYNKVGATPATFKVGVIQSGHYGDENGGVDLDDDDALQATATAAPAVGAAPVALFDGLYSNTRFDTYNAPYRITVTAVANVTAADNYVFLVEHINTVDNG